MTLIPLLKTWLIGIAIAAPIGPIGMLCIRKTLEFGLRGTIAVGFGAALVDGLYSIIASTGLSAISCFLLKKIIYIKIMGGFFLLYLAFNELRILSISSQTIKNNTRELVKLTGEVFLLTLTNPMTILSFISLFASIIDNKINIVDSRWLVLGIFLGSMTWWLILGLFICKVKHKLPKNYISYINFISAFIIGGFGIYVIFSGLISINE